MTKFLFNNNTTRNNNNVVDLEFEEKKGRTIVAVIAFKKY